VYRLQEFLRRRARLQRVEEAVNRNIVIGFFDTVYWSRRLRDHRRAKTNSRMTMVPQFSVPEIFVDEPAHDDTAIGPLDGSASGIGPPSVASSTPSSPMMAPGMATPGSGSEAGDHSGLASRRPNLPPLITRTSAGSIQLSPTASPTVARLRNLDSPALNSPTWSRTPGGHRASPSVGSIGDDWHLAEALSRPTSRDGTGPGENTFASSGPKTPTTPGRHGRTLSTMDVPGGREEAESRSRANSNVSAQDVLEVLDNSVWGESIRRSFTTKRPGSGESGTLRDSGGSRKKGGGGKS
jgi:voltage-dependent calcium channel